MLSSYPPLLVYPDVPEARADLDKKGATRELVTLCNRYELDRFPVTPSGYQAVRKPCRNRRLEAPANSWCYRCIAGYPVSYRRLT